MTTTIILADDHELFREGLKTLLENDPAFSVVASAEDGVEAVRLVRQHNPDVVVMDVAMPRMNGIEATRKIVQEKVKTRVVALSMHEDMRLVSEALDAGARGYLLKDCALQELREGIRTVMAGSIALSRKINDMMILDYLQACRPQSCLSLLNAREREVLQLLTEGRKRREIGDILHISVKTVETHRRNIMTKLNVTSVAELTRLVVREGMPL
ncbi:MAG TPA: response regulator transcription factor [Verrucomicrobiae bacterium]|nr:response regulator transcription factor [Verrucomicrobiae bacterium]